MTSQKDNTSGPVAGYQVSLVLNEWEQANTRNCPKLRCISLADNSEAQQLVDRLRGRVTIRGGFQGLEVETTSFVGSVDVGPLRIAIRPKLSAAPLTALFRYAYGLNDLTLVDHTEIPVEKLGLEDLLILMLVREMELLSFGRLVRQYRARNDMLTSPRGSLIMNEIIRRGGVAEVALPCRHFERDLNWPMNQVLHYGIQSAASRALDCDLRRRAYRVAELFSQVDLPRRLFSNDLDRAEKCLTRLTAIYQPALSLIRLLWQSLGPMQESTNDSKAVPGILFDMNVFFQRLISRFLTDNSDTFCIDDERPIRGAFAHLPGGNPRQRRELRPRPDFTLVEQGRVRAFLDAKYRDLWLKSLPAHWVYQLGIYALNAPARISVLLYATMSEDAREERQEVRSPTDDSPAARARIIIRPVILPQLLSVLGKQGADGTLARRQLANRLVDRSDLGV